MSKSKIEETSKQCINVIEISKKMFLALATKEKKVLKNYYNNFRPAFTLNPYAITFFQKNVSNYLLFIDTRINSCYLRVKEFLEKNGHKITSYCCVGDADFIVEYSATEMVHKHFKEEIFKLIIGAPRENDKEKLVESFKISKTFILKGTENNYSEKNEYELNTDEIQKISQIQSDYLKKNVFQNESQVKSFLQELRNRQILLGYYQLGDTTKATTKAYVLLLYTLPGYEHIVLKNKNIKDKIIDFHSINTDCVYDEFYKKANFLITAQFCNIDEYHNWKENLYKLSKDNENQINVMTFILENKISEIPNGIGNYALFDEIAKSYNTGVNNKIIIGQPYYYSEIKNNYNICVHLNTLKENGFIIGEPGTGKTYTATVLSKKLFDKKKRVHIIDCTGGISGKFTEVFPDFPKEFIKHVDTINLELQTELLDQSNHILFYQPRKEDYCKLASKIANHIIEVLNPDEIRTTNNIIIFEEAHLLFNDENTSKVLKESITISGRKGFSIWFSTQKLSHLPAALHSNLRNRIVHKVDNAEKKEVAKLLLSSDEESIYEDLEKELISLGKGQAIISLVFPQKPNDKELSPLKIIITK